MSRIEQLHKLLDANPDDNETRYMIAMEHKSAAEHDQALACFDECLRRDPRYIPAYISKARTYVAVKRFEDAKAVFNLGIEQALAVGDTHMADEMKQLLEALG